MARVPSPAKSIQEQDAIRASQSKFPRKSCSFVNSKPSGPQLKGSPLPVSLIQRMPHPFAFCAKGWVARISAYLPIHKNVSPWLPTLARNARMCAHFCRDERQVNTEDRPPPDSKDHGSRFSRARVFETLKRFGQTTCEGRHKREHWRSKSNYFLDLVLAIRIMLGC